ncbi:MAG: thiol-disulfide oxidoreductase DCC family protein [Luteolibacter sp.]
MGWVMFFDGDCAFCSASVRRAVRFDTHERISFAPLQGKLAAEKGFTRYAAKSGGSMVLLRESDNRVFTRSDAMIEMARALGGWWRICTLARWIPRTFRDWGYDLIANHRYLLAGKSDTCTVPDPAVLKRLRD